MTPAKQTELWNEGVVSLRSFYEGESPAMRQALGAALYAFMAMAYLVGPEGLTFWAKSVAGEALSKIRARDTMKN